MPRVEVARERTLWRDRIRRYRVVIDGERVGTLRPGATASFDVSPGMHVVQIKIDWMGSPPVSIQLEDNDVAYLRCRPTPRPFRPLAGSHREGWISLEVVTARRL